MSTENTPTKRRISFEVDEQFLEELETAKQGTGLGFPELGKVGLIKVIREWKRTGTVVAEALPQPHAA